MIIKSVISVIIALLLGNGAVVWFNNMPVRWFQEEGENLPSSLIADIESERQRLPSTPWKLVFTVFFGSSGVFLSIRESSQFMIAGMLLIFIVTMMAICDAKYRIIPDQLNVLLAVSAVGFAHRDAAWTRYVWFREINLPQDSNWRSGHQVLHINRLGYRYAWSDCDIHFDFCFRTYSHYLPEHHKEI